MAERKIKPELDLPGKIVDLMLAYIGPRRVNKLTILQRVSLMNIATNAAAQVGMVLDNEDTNVGQLKLEHKSKED